MAQGGNVWEWMETAYDGTNDTAGEIRELRGGGWNANSSYWLDASFRNDDYHPTAEGNVLGFRVASVPEPSSLSLLALGGVVVALRKCKRV
jgi:formylglycine-generating enzyme required for sulfatase activity